MTTTNKIETNIPDSEHSINGYDAEHVSGNFIDSILHSNMNDDDKMRAIYNKLSKKDLIELLIERDKQIIQVDHYSPPFYQPTVDPNFYQPVVYRPDTGPTCNPYETICNASKLNGEEIVSRFVVDTNGHSNIDPNKIRTQGTSNTKING